MARKIGISIVELEELKQVPKPVSLLEYDLGLFLMATSLERFPIRDWVEKQGKQLSLSVLSTYFFAPRLDEEQRSERVAVACELFAEYRIDELMIRQKEGEDFSSPQFAKVLRPFLDQGVEVLWEVGMKSVTQELGRVSLGGVDLGELTNRQLSVPSSFSFAEPVFDPAWHDVGLWRSKKKFKIHGWHADRWVRRYGATQIEELAKSIKKNADPDAEILLGHSGRIEEWELFSKWISSV